VFAKLQISSRGELRHALTGNASEGRGLRNHSPGPTQRPPGSRRRGRGHALDIGGEDLR
jgi:hypothetical protein